MYEDAVPVDVWLETGISKGQIIRARHKSMHGSGPIRVYRYTGFFERDPRDGSPWPLFTNVESGKEVWLDLTQLLDWTVEET